MTSDLMSWMSSSPPFSGAGWGRPVLGVVEFEFAFDGAVDDGPGVLGGVVEVWGFEKPGGPETIVTSASTVSSSIMTIGVAGVLDANVAPVVCLSGVCRDSLLAVGAGNDADGASDSMVNSSGIFLCPKVLSDPTSWRKGAMGNSRGSIPVISRSGIELGRLSMDGVCSLVVAENVRHTVIPRNKYRESGR